MNPLAPTSGLAGRRALVSGVLCAVWALVFWAVA
jgi:hypothetical protein